MTMTFRSLFCAALLAIAPSWGASGASPLCVLEPIRQPDGHETFSTGWLPLGLKAADLKEKQTSPGHITDVGEAQIQFHFPAGWKPQDKRATLCVCPGGGYAIQAIDKEGVHIARWAAEHGMVGIVVKYRVSQGNNAVGRFPGPLLDARQALRLARRNAGTLGIDPHRIGIIGFSAGGHLAAMTATLWNRALPEEADNPLKSVSARPDFAMLVYPVITMEAGTTHGGTRSRILGPDPDPAMEQLCSAERQVTNAMPPVFLVHALDDGVACANSRLMEEACRSRNVPVTLRLYPKGGHGYGMEKRGNPTDAWPQAAEEWLAERGILSSRTLPAGNAAAMSPERAKRGRNEGARP